MCGSKYIDTPTNWSLEFWGEGNPSEQTLNRKRIFSEKLKLWSGSGILEEGMEENTN